MGFKNVDAQKCNRPKDEAKQPNLGHVLTFTPCMTQALLLYFEGVTNFIHSIDSYYKCVNNWALKDFELL